MTSYEVFNYRSGETVCRVPLLIARLLTLPRWHRSWDYCDTRMVNGPSDCQCGACREGW